MPPTDRPNLRLEPATAAGVVAHLINCPKLTELTTPAMETQVLGLAGELGAAHLTLDLDAVSYVSSAGLALCLALNNKLRDAGGQLTLCGVCADVYEVFDVTGLTRVLAVQRKV